MFSDESGSLSTATSPSWARTITKTYTRKVEERSPGKVTIRTTSRTSKEAVTKTPVPTARPPREPTPHEDFDDSDDPNEDATISFATDSEDESHPTSPPPSWMNLTAYTTASSQPPTRPSSTVIPAVPAAHVGDPVAAGAGNPGNEGAVSAYYEARYPGLVPHLDKIDVHPTKFKLYYVVTGGTSVGIFTDW
ncbi:hypothetical protein AAF712_009491 [Marasmius tenuissimus]|uniref:Uncharacterized protein n=1 Tax=Marasmius tenuissimus TaxID=585030 RepID=A0ABR2ZQX6_9AGAR